MFSLRFLTRTCAAIALALTGTIATLQTASAQARYFGEVFIMAGGYCPINSLEANGAILQISQHSVLFSLLGTTYGGDGRATFALPDLRGRAPVHSGTGRGLPTLNRGRQAGQVLVPITVNNLPPHSHPITQKKVRATSANGTTQEPRGMLPAKSTNANSKVYADRTSGTNVEMHDDMLELTLGNTGGGALVNIQSPVLGMLYCVTTRGLFPSR